MYFSRSVVKRCFLGAFFGVSCVVGLFFLVTSWFYITCPVYQFEEQQPFSGTKFYNPYQTMADDAWMKCIFHLHTKSWLGLTNGENTFEETMAAYRQLNYDVIAVSDYMQINRNESEELHPHASAFAGMTSGSSLPVYEHGYNVKKVHQLALGAGKVVWRDYLFKQNLHHKQHIIDVLKKHSTLVAINHPSMRSSYLPADFKYLRGYDLMEVLNGTHISEEAWDAALSGGYPAWLIANDDSHSVNNPLRLQREVTYVNIPTPHSSDAPTPHSSDAPKSRSSYTPSSRSSDAPKSSSSGMLTGNDVLNRLSQGVAFGVHFPRKQQATMEERRRESEAVTFPVSIQVDGDTLQVVWQQTMQQIAFIGDNGKIRKTVTGSDSASYVFQPEDTYIRVKLTSPENLVYYLNPVVRYSGGFPVAPSCSQIDHGKTCLKRVVFALVFGIIIAHIIMFLRKKVRR